jgi:hypothetical protein
LGIARARRRSDADQRSFVWAGNRRAFICRGTALAARVGVAAADKRSPKAGAPVCEIDATLLTFKIKI